MTAIYAKQLLSSSLMEMFKRKRGENEKKWQKRDGIKSVSIHLKEKRKLCTFGNRIG